MASHTYSELGGGCASPSCACDAPVGFLKAPKIHGLGSVIRPALPIAMRVTTMTDRGSLSDTLSDGQPYRVRRQPAYTDLGAT